MNIWSVVSLSKGLRKGSWTAEEDSLLRQCIDKYGEGKWHQVPLRAGLNRCRKSCRLRWLNYLKPSIKRGNFSSDEVDLLLRLHKLLGNRWSLIAGRLPGRTANDVKNYWNTHLSKKHESFSRTKMKKKYVTSSSLPPPTKEVQRTEVVKPRPRSFSSNNSYSHINGLPEVKINPSCFGDNNDNVCGNSITCNNFESEYNLTDEDNMWLESLLEDSQETDVVGPEAMDTNKETPLTFDDVEQLWSLFDGESGEIKYCF